MSDSERPCEYCGEGAWGSSYTSDGKQEFLLCSGCRKEWEEKLGHSHKFVARKCPTCHDLKDLRIVPYTKDDPGVKECVKCGAFVEFVNNNGKCEDCFLQHDDAEEPEEETCPECHGSIMVVQGHTISGWATESKTCMRCDWKTEPQKKHKLQVIELPEGVKPLESF